MSYQIVILMTDRAWTAIFDFYDIHDHDFNVKPFYITANEIKDATRQFKATRDREPRVLCKHDTRESRPQLFVDRGLFLLPVKNGHYAIIQGEGYIDIPPIDTTPAKYISQLDFKLDTVSVGDSEMQHVNYAYAASLIRSVMDDDSLVLTIRGRKYTPPFAFRVGETEIETRSVQTEVDAGYEGRNQVVLLKNLKPFVLNIPVQSLLYPYLMLNSVIDKPIHSILVEYVLGEFGIWKIQMTNLTDFNSFQIVSSSRWKIEEDYKSIPVISNSC